MLTGDTGETTDQYWYTAYGELEHQASAAGSQDATENSFLYAGEQYDELLDQYYLRARYYAPDTGRFTQMDTWLGRTYEPLTLNKYLYGGANPVIHVDRSGESYTAAQVSVGLAIGSVLALSMTNAYQAGQILPGSDWQENWRGTDAQIGLLILLTLSGSGSAIFDMTGVRARERDDPECGQLFGPFYRYELEYDLLVQAFSSNWLYGRTPQGGLSPAVQAYRLPQAGGSNELRFCTPVKPQDGGPVQLWRRGMPGVIDHDEETVKIPIRPLR